MHRFEYFAPTTVEEALALIARYGEEAKVLAGGQSLVPLLNYRLARPRVVVDINRLPLDGVSVEDGRLRLGALTRHWTLQESGEIARLCPVLAEAAALIGNVRVRTLGTLGGSLAHADPAAELPMVMVALDVRLSLEGRRGRRAVSASEFFKGYLATALEPDELLSAVEVPVTRGMGHAVEEFARRAGDFAIVAVAALVRLDRTGRVEDARLAFAGVAPTPVRALRAEDVLRGHEPTAERLGLAAMTARDALSPESDAFVSAAYRRHLAAVLTRRALARAVERARRDYARTDAAPSPQPSPSGGSGSRFSALAAGGGEGQGEGGHDAERALMHRAREGRVMRVTLTINGRERELEVLPHQTLLDVLRDTLGIFDAKEGCGEGVCGACTVLFDGRPVSSCLVLAPMVHGHSILTLRGLEEDGELHPLQEAFVGHGAVQCGFCTPGMLLTAFAFVERNPRADREAIRRALAGNLCRCTGYAKILDAVEAYAHARATHG